MKIQISLFLILSFISCFIDAQQKLTLEEAVTGQFRQFAPETLSQNQWIKDTDNFTYLKDNTVWISTIKGPEKKLFSLDELNEWKGGSQLKAIPTIVWLEKDVFYFEADNKVYECNVKTKKIVAANEYETPLENQDYHPASKQIAYTGENNLWLKSNGKSIQITNNSEQIVSGQSISRNEYGIAKGTFWNNAGSRLAFYQKDESKVSNYPLTNYTQIPAVVREIKYPFAGMASELVSVGIYDISSGKTIFLKPKNSEGDQFYLTNLSWAPDNRTVYVVWLNRKTTDMRLIAFDASTGEEIKTLFSEHDEKWLEPEHPAMFVPGKPNQFLWLSRRDGFTNIYHYTTDGKLLNQTSFKFDVKDIISFDKKSEYAFITATGDNPTNSLCYKVKLSDMSATLLTPSQGIHTVKVSDIGSYVIDQYSNLNTPNKIDLLDSKGRVVRNLLTAKNPYETKAIGQTELFTIKADDGMDLWCRLIKPSDFNQDKKYPVVVYVYNGPHVQLVTNGFLGGSSLWMNYLAERGYLVFTVDGHGSAHRGRAFEQVIHRQLGTQEIVDQLKGVEWLKKQSFVDADRMAIHGWSYGGFMTTSLMLRTPGTFKVGVAGGPVIDWALYEVMYGERYMDTPQENPEGYRTADLTQHVKNLKGDLLMIHGADDDVVVMQHNMKFLKACVDNQVQVDFFVYPSHAHNVRGKDRIHLIAKIIDYIAEKL